MPSSAEIRMLLAYPDGAMHDFLKYLNMYYWRDMFRKNKSIKEKSFNDAKEYYDVVINEVKIVSDRISHKDVKSAEFRACASRMGKNVGLFENRLKDFIRSGHCPVRLSKELRAFMPSFSMMIPLANVLAKGKPKLKKEWVRLKPLVKQLKSHLDTGIEKSDNGKVKVVFDIEGDPVVYADKMHLTRAMLNVFHDAVTHSHGETVIVKVDNAKNEVIFSTTNLGRRIPKKIVRVIGEKPYTENIMKQVPHGYGKIAAKSVILAHGGTFTPMNTKKGFQIALTIPKPSTRRMVA